MMDSHLNNIVVEDEVVEAICPKHIEVVLVNQVRDSDV